MSEKKFEAVSDIADSFQQSDAAFEELLDDAELSATWERYHLIGDVMRNETPEQINIDLSAQIAAAVAEEPAILSPQRKTSFVQSVKAKVVQFSKPLGQMAIAASAAGLMILGVQNNSIENESVLPVNQVVKTIPFGGVAEPVSLNYQQDAQVDQKQTYIEQQRRFQALLSDHQQQIKLSSVKANDTASTEKVEKTNK